MGLIGKQKPINAILWSLFPTQNSPTFMMSLLQTYEEKKLLLEYCANKFHLSLKKTNKQHAQVDFYGYTALHAACEAGHADLIVPLLGNLDCK